MYVCCEVAFNTFCDDCVCMCAEKWLSIRFAPYTELQDTEPTLFLHEIVELFGTSIVC